MSGGQIQDQLDALNFDFQNELASTMSKIDPANEPLETIDIRAKKTNISMKLVCLAWVP